VPGLGPPDRRAHDLGSGPDGQHDDRVNEELP
jgi:hypothetical protein